MRFIVILMILSLLRNKKPAAELPDRLARWRAIIEGAAKKYRIDPALITAMIEVESAGNAQAIRQEPRINDASIGLMQILHGTAKGLGYKGTAQGLHDPYINVDLGTRYLRRQLDRYKNQIDLAVAAYNSGTARYTVSGERLINQAYVDKVFMNRSKFAPAFLT